MEPNTMTTQKALTVFFLVFFLVGLTFITPASWVGIQSKNHTPLLLRSDKELAALSEDRNSNNLPDWQDMLVTQVDPNVQEQASKFIVTDTQKKRLDDPNNITASVSKNLYFVNAYAKNKGVTSEEEKGVLAKKILEEETSKITIKEYTVDDIHILPTSSQTSQKNYGNTLGTIFKLADTYKLGSSDLAVMKTYDENHDASILASLGTKKSNVDTIIGKLIETKVPQSAVPYHLILINRLSAYSTALDNMSQVQTDPVRATIAFNSYLDIYKALIASLVTLQQYFIQENIGFTKNDPGFVITQGILK